MKMENILIEMSDTVAIALEVIAGKWGNGEERIRRLKAAAYDADRIQRCVNDLIEIRDKYQGE